MMQPIPLVSGWNLLPFAHFLRGIGAPVERWLGESRIHPERLTQPDGPIPLVHMLDFVERAARTPCLSESTVLDAASSSGLTSIARSIASSRLYGTSSQGSCCSSSRSARASSPIQVAREARATRRSRSG